MPIIVRTFRSRPGRQGELAEGLSTLASAMVRYGRGTSVRYGRGTSVVICRQINDPDHFMWIGDRGGQSDFRRVGLRDDLLKAFEESLAECSPPLSLGFLDEFYRFPPPPCQLWSLEAHAPADEVVGVLSDLFELARLVRRDRHAVGMSLYRAVEDAGTFIGFLTVTWGFAPNQLVRNGMGQPRLAERIEQALVWRPLSVVCEVRQLPAGEAGTGRRRGISSAPFWVRSGEVARAFATPQECEEPPLGAAKHGAQPTAPSRISAVRERSAS